jgi:hypothetical protein
MMNNPAHWRTPEWVAASASAYHVCVTQNKQQWCHHHHDLLIHQALHSRLLFCWWVHNLNGFCWCMVMTCWAACQQWWIVICTIFDWWMMHAWSQNTHSGEAELCTVCQIKIISHALLVSHASIYQLIYQLILLRHDQAQSQPASVGVLQKAWGVASTQERLHSNKRYWQ